MKAWNLTGATLSIPGELRARYMAGDHEFDTCLKVYLELVRRRLLPRRFWYYVRWGWRAFKAEEIQLSGPDAGQPVGSNLPLMAEIDRSIADIPAIIVEYNPICDCGEEKMIERVSTAEGFWLHAWGYADTCYECAVVSSD